MQNATQKIVISPVDIQIGDRILYVAGIDGWPLHPDRKEDPVNVKKLSAPRGCRKIHVNDTLCYDRIGRLAVSRPAG